MKKFTKTIVMGTTIGMTMAAMAVNAYAGQWVSDSTGLWYQNDNGTYPASAWQWIDGDGDGTAECYYFDHNGYLVTGTEVDGYVLNDAGAWAVDGVVQTRATETAAAQETEAAQETVSSSDDKPVQGTMFDQKPTSKRYYGIRKSVTTTTGENWEQAVQLQTWGDGGYANYELDSSYSTLAITVAATSKAEEDGYFTLDVYGDDDELLYSETYEAGESPKYAVIDISGQSTVRFFADHDGGWPGYNGIYIKTLELR